MKSLQWLILALYLSACQAQTTRTITILDEGKVISVSTSAQIPSSILAEAGIAAQPTDRILVNGIPYALSDKITDNGHIQLQLLHAVNIILISPQGEQKIQTSAFTVGDVLKEAGIKIGIHDRVTPPPSTPVTESLTIEFSPARELIITSGGMSLTIHSAAKTIGEALAEAGIPLQGLDTSFPAENEALPADGQIRVVRVSESISVEIQSIPFSTEEAESADVAFGQQEILQNGVNGLAMTRTRIRYEDGVEVSRMDEGRTVFLGQGGGVGEDRVGSEVREHGSMRGRVGRGTRTLCRTGLRDKPRRRSCSTATPCTPSTGSTSPPTRPSRAAS